MNIIKIQDQLKSVPDNTLVGYVENPTGQVPTYLALSELQRRKDMRSKYQANKPEEKTVAEDLVQEVQPQVMGVAGLPEAQPMMEAMQPPPEMPIEQMAQGGLADLDVGNMYDENNYANGGIVAFADGGSILDRLRLGFASPDEIRSMQNTTSSNPFMGGMPPADRDPMVLQYQRKALYDELEKPGANKLEIYNKINEIDAKIKDPYGVGGYTPPKEVPSPKPEVKPKPETKKETTPSLGGLGLEKVKGIGDYAKELQDYIGPDESRKALNERIAKMDARAASMEEKAPWFALAKAGFEAASARPEFGKGQSAAADFARGAGVGIKDYMESQEKLATLEEKRFNLSADIAKADRAEKIAIAKYGADSKQAIEERNFKIKLQERSLAVQKEMNDADNAAAIAKAMLAGKLDQKDLLKYKNQYRSENSEYLAWREKMIKDKGEKIVNTKEFKDASDAYLNQLIARDLNQTKGTASASTIDTSQWSLAS